MTWIIWKLLFRRHLAYFGIVLAVLGTLTLCVSLAENSRRGARIDIPFGLVFEVSLLETPAALVQQLPIAFLIAMLWSHARLTGTNLVLAIRSAGFTPWHTLLPAIVAGLTIGALTVGVFAPISAQFIQRQEVLEIQHFRRASSLLAVLEGGIWLREGDDHGQTVIHAESANQDGTRLDTVEVFRLQPDGKFVQRITADAATLAPGRWVLDNAHLRDIDSGGTTGLPQVRLVEDHSIPTGLTPGKLRQSVAPPEAISFWELAEFIRTLELSGLDASRHKVHWHLLLSLPVFLCVMALVAAAAGLRHPVLKGRVFRICGAVLVGIAQFFALQIADILASSGQILAGLAIWGTVCVSLLLAAGAYLFMEPG